MLGFNYKKLTLISNDNRVTLDIGRYRVKNYKKDLAYANANQTISFDVANGNDFYNDVIKESNYYVSKLDYKVDEYVAIGFLIKDNHLFEYKIKDNNVIIMATQSYYSS
ncbi:MAG: hypothetical protein K6G28_06620, partial [Acholeplasmatales bacterium]|nr:hypothetical protein [Acholeplasmatales bacterium]